MGSDKITVTGIDDARIKQHSTNSDYIELPFILAGNPDDTWKGICVSEYANTKTQYKRRMFIAEELIIIVANVDDDLADHKRIIEQVVDQTNKKYAALSRQAKQQEEKIKSEQQQIKAKITDFKKRAEKLFP